MVKGHTCLGGVGNEVKTGAQSPTVHSKRKQNSLTVESSTVLLQVYVQTDALPTLVLTVVVKLASGGGRGEAASDNDQSSEFPQVPAWVPALPRTISTKTPTESIIYSSTPYHTVHISNPVNTTGNRSRPVSEVKATMYSHTPPAPPPKPPGSHHDVSRMSTPASGPVPCPPPLPEAIAATLSPRGTPATSEQDAARPQDLEDPGDQWLPKFLEDKSCVPQSPRREPPPPHAMARYPSLTPRLLGRDLGLASRT